MKAHGPEDKFLSVKELSDRPLKMNQPVFYISTVQPPPPKKAEEEGSSEVSLGGGKRTRSRTDKLEKGKEIKGYPCTVHPIYICTYVQL